MGVDTRFNDWINRRIEEFDFINDIDYLKLSNNDYQGIGKPNIEYIISLDMAKELSMVEKNDKGKEARKYFIECEKRLKENSKPMTAMQILETQLAIMKEQEAKMLKLEAEQKELTTKQAETDNKIKLIEAKVTTSNSDYYSVSGYASLKGFKHLDVRKANLIGRMAAKLSREYDVEIGKVKDEKWGHVNIYHIDILNEAFNYRS